MSIPTEDEVFFAAKEQLHKRAEVLKYYAKYMYLMKLKESTLGVRPTTDNYTRSLVVYSPEEIYLHRNTSYIHKDVIKKILKTRDWKAAHPSYKLITRVIGGLVAVSFFVALLSTNPTLSWIPTNFPVAVGIIASFVFVSRIVVMDRTREDGEEVYPLDELLQQENTDVARMENISRNVDHLITLMKTLLKTNASEYYEQIEAEESLL